jgi:hypothetical protein
VDFEVPRGACDCHVHVFSDPAKWTEHNLKAPGMFEARHVGIKTSAQLSVLTRSACDTNDWETTGLSFCQIALHTVIIIVGAVILLV